jgi:hypothetical protein
MKDGEFRNSKSPAPQIGLTGHSRAVKTGEMNAKLNAWLRDRELGYKEISFGFQNFGQRKKQENHDEQ